MKKNNIFRFAAALMMGCAMCAVSCVEPAPDPVPDPVFPQMTEKVVTPGETVVLTFDANLDWEVSVPESALNMFWIQDGAFRTYKVSGKAADAVSVEVSVSETETFENASCEVSMTMGGETKTIAKLTRLAKETTFSLSAAVLEEGEFKYNEDGSGYAYGEADPEMLSLVWMGSDFRLPVKVDANFNWTVKTPSWASVDVPENAVGTTTVNIMGVPSEFPLEDTSDKIGFYNGDKLVKEYAVSIPGCEDIFSYTVDMSLSELVYNYVGKVKTATGFIDGPAGAYISGTSGVSVLAVEVVDGKYAADTAPSWLSVEVEDYDSAAGADVLQTRRVTMTAAANEGEDRHAAVFFLPPASYEDKTDLFNDTCDAVKEEYAKYMLPVTQLSINQDFIMMLSAPSEMAENGAEFSASKDQNLFVKFGDTKFAYELHYTNRYASDYARMYFSTPVTSYKVFDAASSDKTDSEDFFLSVSLDDDKNGGVILMDSDTKSSGYVVFYGSTGNVLAVVKCVLDPEKVIGEVADVSFLGESEMYAPMAGATLKHVTSGTVYDQYKEYGVPIYHLTYTMENMPMLISIPASIKSYMPNPWALINNFRINGMDYDDGTFERIDGGVQVYMSMPEGKSKIDGNIMFYNSKSPNNEKLAIVLVCTLDLRDQAE